MASALWVGALPGPATQGWLSRAWLPPHARGPCWVQSLFRLSKVWPSPCGLPCPITQGWFCGARPLPFGWETCHALPPQSVSSLICASWLNVRLLQCSVVLSRYTRHHLYLGAGSHLTLVVPFTYVLHCWQSPMQYAHHLGAGPLTLQGEFGKWLSPLHTPAAGLPA